MTMRGSIFDDEYGVFVPETITVYEIERRETNTGLLDAQGRPLIRIDNRGPLGFDIRPKSSRPPTT